MADIAALEETMAAVERAAEQGRWVQSEWVSPLDAAGNWCRTAGCFAGHRAFLDGYELVDTAQELVDGEGHSLFQEDVRRYAQRALELTDKQAVRLFAGGNTLEDLRLAVKEIIDQEESHG
jgi:hypothetical protein